MLDSVPGAANATNDDNLFEYGLDSVKIIEIIARLRTEIRNNSELDLAWINAGAVYKASSINGLAKVLDPFLNQSIVPNPAQNSDRTAAMEALVSKFSQFDRAKMVPMVRSQGQTSRILLVGSTGYLGPHILAALLKHTAVKTIHCLNRTSDAQERTERKLDQVLSTEQQGRLAVSYSTMDLSAPLLGLDKDQLGQLFHDADVVIYNSWNPDFNAPLQAFEPFLQGLQTLVDGSMSSDNVPRLIFLSSTSAVGDWGKKHPESPAADETWIDELSVSMPIGYGESKAIAERILNQTQRNFGSLVKIARIGQIGGLSVDSQGDWALQKWIWSIVKTSKTLGLVPTGVAPIDWLSVNTTAEIIVKMAVSDDAADVCNLVHPSPVSWDVFVEALENLGIKGERTSLPQWLDKVEEAFNAKRYTLEELPALQLMDFLRALGEGRERDMKFVTKNMESLQEAPLRPITSELLTRWLEKWSF